MHQICYSMPLKTLALVNTILTSINVNNLYLVLRCTAHKPQTVKHFLCALLATTLNFFLFDRLWF